MDTENVPVPFLFQNKLKKISKSENKETKSKEVLKPDDSPNGATNNSTGIVTDTSITNNDNSNKNEVSVAAQKNRKRRIIDSDEDEQIKLKYEINALYFYYFLLSTVKL